MALKSHDVLVPGSYFCDVIFTGMPAPPSPGAEVYCRDVAVVPGGMLNTVVAMKRLGLKVAWAGVLGNDFFSRFIREWVEREELDLSLVDVQDQPFRRLTVALTYQGDRAFVTYTDPPPDLVDLVRQHLDGATYRHLHFSGLVVDERMPALLRECRARGMEISMDCQHREQTLDDPLLRETLGLLDLFMPNEVEARRLTGSATTDEAAALLGQLVPLLVIKQGAAGASCWQNGECRHAPAPAVAAIDTTGAGDVFNAAFIAARLAGAPSAECLRHGVVAGSLSVTGAGGANSAPDRCALLAALARHAEQCG